jgi:hypothetical protein
VRRVCIVPYRSEDIDWFVNLPYSLSIPAYNAIVVHAGLVPGVPLDQQDGSDMYQMRNLVSSCKDTTTTAAGSCGSVDNSSSGKSVSSTVSEWKAIASGKEGVAWASEWKVKDGPHVYFGHDAKRGLQLFDNATGLDTGCCYGELVL